MFGAAPPPLSKRELKKYDADGNGQLDVAEFQLYCFQKGHLITAPELTRAFQQIDRDGSGEIDSEEFTAWFKERERWASLNIPDREAHVQCFTGCASYNEAAATVAAADVPAVHAALTARALTAKPLAALQALVGAGSSSHCVSSEHHTVLQYYFRILVADDNTRSM